MNKKIENFWKRCLNHWFGKEFFYVLSVPYQACILLRNELYNCGYFKAKKLSSPVISIGNLSLGGTGKTSLVLECLSYFTLRQKKSAVLSRGYKRASKQKPFLVCDGKAILADVQSCGDEAFLIAQKFGQSLVALDSNRYRAGTFLEKNFAPEIFILDDGFQHRSLHRDLNIVLLDDNIFTFSGIFPSGTLREHADNILRADFVLIQSEKSIKDYSDQFKKRFSILWNVPCARWLYQPNAEIIEGLKKKNVIAFCALANPENFFKMLKDHGLNLVQTLSYADHCQLSSADLNDLKTLAKNQNAVLCTSAKDAVKLPPDFDCKVIEVNVNFVENSEVFFAMLDKVIL